MKRIIGTFTKQAWVGPKKDRALEIEEVRFDATRAVLLLSLNGIHELQDNDESTDEIGLACIEFSGPFEVSVVESVLDFFGVESLIQIDKELLDLAREEFGVPGDDKTKLRLTLDVTYTTNLTPDEVLRDNLEHMVRRAIGEGMLTGYTDAEVDGYEMNIAVRLAETVIEEESDV